MKDSTFVPGERVFTTGQLAKAAECNPSTIWRDIQRGTLAARRAGATFVIDEGDAGAYIAQRIAKRARGDDA